MIVSGTGHRPNKLGGYSPQANTKLVGIILKWLRENKVEKVISGMALGWDTALAHAAEIEGIYLLCAIPFEGQELIWPRESKIIYNSILDNAHEVVVTSSGGYSPAKMQIRNQWMVDNSDLVLAMWDGTTGGTYNCIKYAESKNKQIINLYSQFK